MSRLSFTEALDQALELLEQGHPLEHCVRQFPEYADELRPLLQVSDDLHRLADAPLPLFAKTSVEPDWDALLADIPQDKPHRLKPYGIGLGQILQRVHQHPIQRYAALAAAILIFALVSWRGSAQSTPRSALYPIKQLTEQVELTVAQAGAPETRVELHIKLARRRLEELQTLAVETRQVDPTLIAAALQEAEAALREAKASDGVDPSLFQALNSLLNETSTSLNQLQAGTPADQDIVEAVAQVEQLRQDLDENVEVVADTTSSTATATALATPTTVTATSEPVGGATTIAQPTSTATAERTATANPTATPTVTAPAVRASTTPVPVATSTPTAAPTIVQLPVPTALPLPVPTAAPVAVPTVVPTSVPTPVPTAVPTDIPTIVPTAIPTEAPTQVPTEVPTQAPTTVPTEAPTEVPTIVPTQVPTVEPTFTATPSAEPTLAPLPTEEAPTAQPTEAVTEIPTDQPTTEPTQTVVPQVPTDQPTTEPTGTTDPFPSATSTPTSVIVPIPITVTIVLPTATDGPTITPTMEPTIEPTTEPTSTTEPTVEPTGTTEPTVTSTAAPTLEPTLVPTEEATATALPTEEATIIATVLPPVTTTPSEPEPTAQVPPTPQPIEAPTVSIETQQETSAQDTSLQKQSHVKARTPLRALASKRPVEVPRQAAVIPVVSRAQPTVIPPPLTGVEPELLQDQTILMTKQETPVILVASITRDRERPPKLQLQQLSP